MSRNRIPWSGQSHLIFGTGSTGSVTTRLLSKLCSALALYKPLENGEAITVPLPLLAILSRCFRGFFREHQRLEDI